MRRRLAWLYLSVCGALALWYFAAAHGTELKLLFYTFGLSSVVAVLVGVRLHRPATRLPWFAFAVGLLLFALGDIAFDLYDWAGVSTPVPSIADALYLAAYPMLTVGLVLLVRSRMKGTGVVGVLDGSIAAIGIGVVGWVFLIEPYLDDRTLTVTTKLVSVAYPLLDILLVPVVARLLIGGARRNTAYWLLCGALMALLAADAAYTVATLNGTYRDGSLVDLGWIASYAMWGAAALHPSMVSINEPAERGPRVSAARLVTLGVSSLAPPAVLVIENVRGEPRNDVILALATAAMFVVALLRVGVMSRLLDRSNRRLMQTTQRERALKEAAVSLVAVSTLEELAATTVDAAALAPSGRECAVFAICRPDGLEQIASVGEFEPEHLHAAVDTAAAVDAPPGTAVRVVRAVQSRPRPDDRDEVYMVGSIGPPDQPRAVLVVSARPGRVDEMVPLVDALCSNAWLALRALEALETRVRASHERRFQSLVQHGSDVITVLGVDRIVRYQSPSITDVFGYQPHEIVGGRISDLLHPDDLEAAHVFVARAITDQHSTVRAEFRMRHADGSWRDVETNVTNLLDDPDVGGIVLNTRDVTERVALARQLRQHAFHDPLTGLANRALFFDRVTQALSRALRGDTRVGILFLDLDDFKMVNDSLGHSAGDELLREIGERLRHSVRPGDTIARLGGDEFAIVVEDDDPGAVEAVAERIMGALDTPVTVAGEQLLVRASIGIATAQPGERRGEDLMRDADVAMYVAKRNGKGRYVEYTPAMQREAMRWLETAAELRGAIDEGQLAVYYQPITDIHTGRLSGAEALVRWLHPTRGLVPPNEFIPVAESSGLILALGRFVLERACRDAQAWRRERLVDADFSITVNLSGRQIQSATIIDDVRTVLEATGLPARCLMLEITETVLMEGTAARDSITGIKALGARFAIDDFGTGYSSLAYLSNFPVDVIKIDKSFIDRLTEGPEGVALVRSVIDMSHAMGLVSIAEGIEQQGQLAVLGELGCDRAQGFLLARPMPSEEMDTLLRRERGQWSHPELDTDAVTGPLPVNSDRAR